MGLILAHLFLRSTDCTEKADLFHDNNRVQTQVLLITINQVR